MPHEVLIPWLKSRKHAQLDGICARPRPHPLMKDQVVVVERGQAAALILLAEDGSVWILKKFHPGRCPDLPYLSAISGILPRHDGLLSGTQRRLLTGSDLKRSKGRYYCSQLSRWIDRSVMMPQVQGVDWATIADDLRDGSLQLDRDQRVALCRALAQLSQLLESSGCAHRDFSSGNVFIDTAAWKVLLIDFDSLYHVSLQMPAATTCGTDGYTGPFVWRNGRASPDATWCTEGDRFALALLCAEFLVLEKDAPLGAEGGMFDQQQLRARSGSTLRLARERLKKEFPDALGLFDTALGSQSCADCPAPDKWLSFCDAVLGPTVQPAALNAFENARLDDFTRILQRRIPAAPVWPAPLLDELPEDAVLPPVTLQSLIPLPEDPWTKSTELSVPEQNLLNAAPDLESMEDPWS